MKKGWATKPLGDACDNLDSKRVPITKAKRSAGEYPYYGASGVVDRVADYLFDDDLLLVSEDGANLLARTYPIAFSISGKVWVNNHAHVLKFASNESQRFIEYYLNSIPLDAYVSGMAQPKLNQKSLNSIPVPAPPLPEQRRIVGILDEAFAGIATAKANTEKNLQNARALFESHLQSVFTQRGKGWVERPMSEVCNLQNGYAFKSSDYVESSNTLNIRMSSIRPGGNFDSEHNQRFLPDSYAEDYSAFLLKEGDLIIAMTDMAGDPKILGVPTLVSGLDGGNFLMNQRVGKLFGFSNNIRIPYLRYFLASPSMKHFYKSKGAGGLQINISKGDILSAVIPLPSLATQDGLVEQLDALSKDTQRLESIYQRKLDALDELKKSLLHQAFTGEL